MPDGSADAGLGDFFNPVVFPLGEKSSGMRGDHGKPGYQLEEIYFLF